MLPQPGTLDAAERNVGLLANHYRSGALALLVPVKKHPGWHRGPATAAAAARCRRAS
jgi:hypothetical protein